MFQLNAFINFEDDDLRIDQWASVKSACRDTLFVRRLQDIDASLASTVDSIVVKLGTELDPNDMDRLPRLRCICIFGTDKSGVDTEYTVSHGISVYNLEDYSTNGVAEFQIACILAQVRDLYQPRANAAHGEYSEDAFTGRELHGRLDEGTRPAGLALASQIPERGTRRVSGVTPLIRKNTGKRKNRLRGQ
jgi:phosphoglycerate dehydrogenase-like enzyme